MAVLDLEHLDRPPVILQGSSAFIWSLLERVHDEEELISVVADHYGQPRDEVAPASRAFLEDLAARTLVESL